MIKTFYLCALLYFAHIASASSTGTARASGFTLPNSASYELRAEKLDRTYPIYIATPRGYSKAKKYPVIIMNDGPYAFPVATGALSVPMTAGTIEEVILVGIGFSKGDNMMLSRVRDYSPSVDKNFKQLQPGQAKQYLDFLENELLPFVEQRYAIDAAKRTLVGHSAGGLFASYVLLNRPELFESYVILSPALFWNNKELFGKEKQYAEKHKDLDARVYFATGSTEKPPTSPFNWVAHQNTFVTQLQKHQYPNLQLKADIISGALHETSFPIGFIQAMQWLYSK